jgi:N utilization substance protein A
MYEEFKGKEGEIINGTVQRIEAGKVFIDLGKSTGVLFQSEQIPGENYRIGQRLKLYIDKVDSDPRSLGIGLSRKHPQLLAKLFELEVPEIFAGTVEIKAVAREAGMRSKIAVVSHEEGIDPVGSCVGQKGTRVQAIIDELNGEKIDIIEWIDNAEEMIAQALSPAKVAKVELVEGDEMKDKKETPKESSESDEKNDIAEEEKGIEEIDDSIYKKAIAYVMDDQLSLAIGKRGQNVRLAAKLTGWNINVESLNPEEEPEDGEEKNDEKIEVSELKDGGDNGENNEKKNEKKVKDKKTETKDEKKSEKIKDKKEKSSKKEIKKVSKKKDKKATKKTKEA